MNRSQSAFLAALALLSAALLVLAALPGGDGVDDEGTVRVVASFYPLGYFAEQIGGERVTVRILIPDNQEVHSWMPSTRDILDAARADVLVYNGAGLDPWFEDDILGTVGSDGKVVVATTRGLELLPADGHQDEDGGDAHDHGDWDPHTWTDPVTAKAQARAVYEGLVRADPAGADDYAAGWAVLAGRFDELDQILSSALAGPSHSTFFVVHSAFGYLAHRYGLTQHGLIGISADEQPSASGIASLVEDMEAMGIYTIFVNPQYPSKYATTLERELEGRTGRDVTISHLHLMLGPVDGLDYMDQMEENSSALVRELMAKW